MKFEFRIDSKFKLHSRTSNQIIENRKNVFFYLTTAKPKGKGNIIFRFYEWDIN